MNSERAERLRRRVARQHGLDIIPDADPPRPSQTPPDGGGSELAGVRTLVEGFSATVGRFGERCAVRCGRQRLTYQKLDVATDSLAAAIQARSPVPRRPIGILLERSAELVTAAVAVLKTGSSYLPLEPVAPAARLELIVREAEPALVLTSRALAGRLPTGVPVYIVDDPGAGGAASPQVVRPEPCVEPATRAYIIFTSGTTGQPKGVEVSHANVLWLFTSTEALFGFSCHDVWTLFHSFAFDFSVWEMWGALLYGGCVVVVPGDVAADPVAFRGLLREQAVTVLNQTPTAFLQLRNEELRHEDRLSLRLLMFGGEVLHFSELRSWMAKYGDSAPQLINMYGITETTVLNSWRPVSLADLDEEASLIGRPFPGLDFVLVDENLVPVRDGQVGEIVVTGPGISLGYLNRPELTGERFVRLTGADGRPVCGYRSGDLAVLTSSGDYEYRGRKDEQVKIRGYRVELGEVETVLRGALDVAEIAVLLRDLPGTGQCLVAYLVPTAAAQPSCAAELRRVARGLLPEYMIPASFVFLDRLPVTANGKLDRAALPDPAPDTTGTALDPIALQGTEQPEETERLILKIVRELLPTASVTATSDFFDIGGHSLLATRLLAGVRSTFGVEVTLREFFRSPTPRALARLVRDRHSVANHRPAPPGTPGGAARATASRKYSPATSAQQRLYFLARLYTESTAYNLHTALLLDGPLDLHALRRALDTVLARHEPLRTVFRMVDGEPVQLAQPVVELPLRVEELSVLPEQRWPEHVEHLSAVESALPFDLERDLMMRVRLIRIAPESHALLVTVHHVAFDGWSNAVLGRELTALYRHFKSEPTSTEIPLPPLRYSDADYAHDMRRWLASPDAETDIEYWVRRLADLPAVHRLPLDRPRPARMTYTAATLSRLVPSPAARAVRRLCLDTGVTPFMLFNAVFAVLLARRGGTDDVVLGAPVANRSRTELDDLIGLFVNTIVLRTRLAGSGTFDELLGVVREQVLNDLAHQHVPFELVVKRVNPRRSTSYSPLFQIMLVVQNNEELPLEMDGLRVAPLRPADHTVQTDVVLSVTEHGDGFRFNWTYNTDLFDRETIDGLAAEFERFLLDVATRQDARTESLEPTEPPPHLPLPPSLTSRSRAHARQAGGAPRAEPGKRAGLFQLRRHPGSAFPVFALPGVLGFGSAFAPMSAHIVDRSCYAVHLRDLVAARGDGLSMATLLRDCGRLVASTADARPVHLTGHSFGGCLAFFLVEWLREHGVPVASLTLLDSVPPPVLAAELPTTRTEALRAFLAHLADAFPDAARQWGAQVAEQCESMTEEAVLALVERILGSPGRAIFDGGLASAFRDYLRLIRLSWPAPEPLDCPTLLISAASQPRPPNGAGLASGWRQCLSGQLREERVAASHEGMLRGPHVQQVEAIMREFLADHEAVPRSWTEADPVSP